MSRVDIPVSSAEPGGGAAQFRIGENRAEGKPNAGLPTVLLGHPNGNQNVRNALRSFIEQGMLAEFWTCVAWDAQSWWNQLLPDGVRGQLARRSFPGAPASQVRTLPWREIVRLGMHTMPVARNLCTGERPFSYIGVSRSFDARVARRISKLRPDAVYAYEGAAHQTFVAAKRIGIATLYELPSSYWYWEQDFLSAEARRNPAYANLLPQLSDSAEYLGSKDEELRLADCVFVPSQHVRRSLEGVVPDEKVRVVTYGAPPVRPRKSATRDGRQPLKVLFVGNLIQRKGIGYLLEAIDLLGEKVELTLVGRRFRPNSKVDDACRRWRWFETMPHDQVLELMQQADVLVLPSLSEGCALVVLEALACGLPVIVTPNTGSLSFVRDGQEGFVVPTCQAEIIAERLDALYGDRAMLAEMSRQAQVTAAENSWEQYRANLADAMRSLAWR